MLLIKNIGTLITINNDALGEIHDASVIIHGELIFWCGPACDAPDENITNTIDAENKLVMPGLIDCHSHLIFAGNRADEFARRMNNESYLDIMAKGGGIMNTVNQTRNASDEDLLSLAHARATAILRCGTTTLEAKSGYGLSTEHELRTLRLVNTLDREHALDIHKTFLGAHVVPKDSTREAYLKALVEEMLPEIARANLARDCDVFCEQGAFTVDEARLILRRAHDAGLGLRAHVHQLSRSGGLNLVAELPIKSISHADFLNDDDIALLSHSRCVVEALPFAQAFLRSEHGTPVRALTDAGVTMAIATDFNPGSAMCHDLVLAARLGVVYGGFTITNAIRAITVNAGISLGRNDIGIIKKDALADVIITNVNSVNEFFYDWTNYPIAAVIKRGNIINRQGHFSDI